MDAPFLFDHFERLYEAGILMCLRVFSAEQTLLSCIQSNKTTYAHAHTHTWPQNEEKRETTNKEITLTVTFEKFAQTINTLNRSQCEHPMENARLLQ